MFLCLFALERGRLMRKMVCVFGLVRGLPLLGFSSLLRSGQAAAEKWGACLCLVLARAPAPEGVYFSFLLSRG